MATSSSYNSSMTASQILKHAFDLVGAVPTGQELTPSQLDRGYRSLNMVIRSLELEGCRIHARSIDNRVATSAGGTLGTTLTAGTGTYYLAPETLEVMSDGVILRNSSSIDMQLMAMSLDDYQKISNKSQSGIPSQFVIQPNVAQTDTVVMQGALQITLWPVPNASTYSIRYIRTRKLSDFDSQTDDPDVPQRWIALLVYGVAVWEATRSGLQVAERQMLMAQFAAEKALVLRDDTERGDIYLIPEIPMVRY